TTDGLVNVFNVQFVTEATGLPGDYNQNNKVDAADYAVWRDHLGSSTALPNDDTPGVGADDYTRWKTNFGQQLGSGSLDATSVPEPATACLLAVCGLATWGVGRKRISRA
ncbi:MAG: hypothetical protein AB7I57_08305, partial [Pirellulales bacterium]